MAKIVIHNTKIECEDVLIEDALIEHPLMFLLDEHNHPIEIIDIVEAERGLVPDVCTVKKVLPKVSACIGQLQKSGEMCYLPFDRIKAEAFIVRHSEKKLVCEEDKLTVYVFRSARDGKYCLVNCEPKGEAFHFKEDISEIICGSEDEVRLLSKFFGEDVSARVYQDDSYSMKDMYGLDKALEEFHRSKIYLKSGGNICIDKAVAATLIDVNSGNSTGCADALKVNLEAAVEIARQIRLKNISGQIVIDFINMDDENNKASVKDALCEALTNDRAKTRLFGFTAMGLFEMTRSSGVTGKTEQC